MMMAGFKPAPVVPFHGRVDDSLNEIAFCAWVAQAEPSETLVYHRGFLAFDAIARLSDLQPERQRALRDVAVAAMRAAEQDLVHLVQARLGPGQFAYIAIARRKPRQAGASLSVRLLEAA
jgi:hypothetical protein